MIDLSAVPHPVLNEDEGCYEYEGQKLDRVTQIVHAVTPPYLAPWAEKVGRESVEKLYRLRGGNLPDTQDEIKQAVIQNGWTTEHEKKAGGLRGAEVHFALEAYIKQGIPPTLDDFDPDVRPYAQTLCQWLVDYEPEFYASEITVYHPEFLYAGTVDAIGHTTKHPKGVRHADISGQPRIFDLKTNKDKSVYEQHYVQLAAYELALQAHGVELDGTAVVAIGPMKEKGKPYRVAPSFWLASDFIPVMGMYRTLLAARNRNPNKKKEH